MTVLAIVTASTLQGQYLTSENNAVHHRVKSTNYLKRANVFNIYEPIIQS